MGISGKSHASGRALGRAAVMACLLSMLGCTPFPREASSCLFGGATPREDIACAGKSYGVTGSLYALRGHALLAARDDEQFVRNVAALTPWHVEALYTWPSEQRPANAAALVHTPQGDYVLDFSSAEMTEADGVMALADFQDAYGSDFAVFELDKPVPSNR